MDLTWEELQELGAYDEITSSFENDQFCPDCKKELKRVERTCALCQNVYNYSDSKHPEGTVVRRPEQETKDPFHDLLERRAHEILQEEKVIR